MHIPFVGKVFRGCECKARGGYSFDCGVISKVDEHNRPLNGAGFLQIVNEKLSGLESDSHSSEDYSKFFAFS